MGFPRFLADKCDFLWLFFLNPLSRSLQKENLVERYPVGYLVNKAGTRVNTDADSTVHIFRSRHCNQIRLSVRFREEKIFHKGPFNKVRCSHVKISSGKCITSL
jgi:hypothetical protein